MTNNTATGPDELPIEVIKLMKGEGLGWMMTTCTCILAEVQKTGIPKIWRHNTITPLYKQKGDLLRCSNYKGIKLLSHSLKLWERVSEPRTRDIVSISERQHGFQKGKSTMQPMFCLRILQKKFREFTKTLFLVFVDLGKVYDTAPGELIWYCLQKTSSRGVCLYHPRYVLKL